jgi:hypothetical protein
VTHARRLDMIVDLLKELFVCLGVFAADKDLQRNLAALQRLEVFGYDGLASENRAHKL